MSENMAGKRKRYLVVLGWAVPLLITALVGLAVRGYVIELVRVEGDSMENTLFGGDVVLVNKLAPFSGASGRNDVMLVRVPGGVQFIKRLIGLPGDLVEIESGDTYINGALQEEPFVPNKPTDRYAVTLKEDEYLFMGDNRRMSHDGRAADIGPLSHDDLAGRAVWIVWPIGRFGPVT